MEQDWTELAPVKATLTTATERATFEILEHRESGIRIQAAGRKVTLTFERLDSLWRHRGVVTRAREAGEPLDQAVPRAWELDGIKKDTSNESQYWALLLLRQKAENQAIASGIEGAPVVSTSTRYVRVRELRAACLAKMGLDCVVCGFNFGEAYEGVGEGYIHVHHLQPLAESDGPREVVVDDLVPVCPNCHAMLHQRTPPYTPAEMKTRLMGRWSNSAGDA